MDGSRRGVSYSEAWSKKYVLARHGEVTDHAYAYAFTWLVARCVALTTVFSSRVRGTV
jgi:hypothetical protein